MQTALFIQTAVFDIEPRGKDDQETIAGNKRACGYLPLGRFRDIIRQEIATDVGDHGGWILDFNPIRS